MPIKIPGSIFLLLRTILRLKADASKQQLKEQTQWEVTHLDGQLEVST